MMWLNRRKLGLIVLFLISTTALLICGGPAQAGKKVAVFVSIPPQKYFLQQIGKQRVDVQVMVQPGASPATYEPKPRQMAAISRTCIYAIGVPFEKTWLKKIAAANTNVFVSKLAVLDADSKKTFAGKQGLQFMVFHPSWGYVARSYGLRQVPVEIEGKDLNRLSSEH